MFLTNHFFNRSIKNFHSPTIILHGFFKYLYASRPHKKCEHGKFTILAVRKAFLRHFWCMGNPARLVLKTLQIRTGRLKSLPVRFSRKRWLKRQSILSFRPPIITFRPSIFSFRPPIITFRPPIISFRPPMITFRPPIISFRPPIICS